VVSPLFLIRSELPAFSPIRRAGQPGMVV